MVALRQVAGGNLPGVPAAAALASDLSTRTSTESRLAMLQPVIIGNATCTLFGVDWVADQGGSAHYFIHVTGIPA